MSRLPRHLEYLKTGFTAEAVSAARFRAYARKAEAEEMPKLAERFRRLAAEKDKLAIAQLEAAGQVRGPGRDLSSAIAEESYENNVLYPKLVRQVAGDESGVADSFRSVVAAQEEHLAELEGLRDAYNSASGDIAG